MAYAKVDVNTNPIPGTILNPKSFGFPSGGGGGGGGGTDIYPTGYNANGASLPAPVMVPIGAEQDLASFVVNFVGGRKALFLGFATFTGATINAKLKLYVNGVAVSETWVSTGQVVSWGLMISTTPGPSTLKIVAENLGGAPLSVPSAETLALEFL